MAYPTQKGKVICLLLVFAFVILLNGCSGSKGADQILSTTGCPSPLSWGMTVEEAKTALKTSGLKFSSPDSENKIILTARICGIETELSLCFRKVYLPTQAGSTELYLSEIDAYPSDAEAFRKALIDQYGEPCNARIAYSNSGTFARVGTLDNDHWRGPITMGESLKQEDLTTLLDRLKTSETDETMSLRLCESRLYEIRSDGNGGWQFIGENAVLLQHGLD